MKTIWKYKIDLNQPFEIKMPKGAEILTVQTQIGDPCIWAIVDTDVENEIRSFELIGTGMSIKETSKRVYKGTFHLFGGRLVLHLFEIIESKS